MSCPVPENFKVFKSAVRKQRHSIILLQKQGLIPTQIMDSHCGLLHYPIITLSFMLRHDCLKKCDGKPCQNLLFFEYAGYPEKDIGILSLLGWSAQHRKLVLARKRHRHKYGFMKPFNAHDILYPKEIVAGASK
jgi:hypothetical protein